MLCSESNERRRGNVYFCILKNHLTLKTMKTLPIDKITKDMFDSYRQVQMAGRWNMIMEARFAQASAGLSEDAYWSIIKNYSELKKKFYPE